MLPFGPQMWTGGHFYFEDVDSLHATFVNNIPLGGCIT